MPQHKNMQKAEAPVTSSAVSPHAAPQPAPTPAVPIAPKTVSSGIEYIQPPQPDYPPIAREMEEEGKVTLRVLVNEQGRAQRVEIQRTSGSTMLDEAARQAMMHAVFKPHIEGGRAVAMNAIAVITFKLNQ